MSQSKKHKVPRKWPLVLIAMDKFIKALLLTAVSLILTPRWSQPVKDWIDAAQAEPHNWLVRHGLTTLENAMGIGNHALWRTLVVVFIGLYLIEGIGLLYEKKWAEWMVVIGTLLFLPIEIYEFIHKPRWSMVIVFIINAVIAYYLLWRMHRQKIVERERHAQEAPVQPPQNTPAQ